MSALFGVIAQGGFGDGHMGGWGWLVVVVMMGGMGWMMWSMMRGAGRRCLGAAFATLEMKIVISTILARTRLRAPRAKSEKVRFRGVTTLPSRGGEAIVEHVAAAAGSSNGLQDQPPR